MSLRRDAGKRGSILLMVLVLIVVVSFALTMFIEKAEVEIKGEGYFVKRSELRRDAWSMLEVAVAVLADVKAIDGSLYAPAQGWRDPLEYAQVTPREGLNVQFEFIDESGKVDINNLDRDSLILLFDELGFDLEISSGLSDVLLDWIDEDDETRIEGAESREYSTLELDAHPANQPLKSLDELRYLFGFRDLFFDENGSPLPIFQQLKDAVTVQEVSSLNVNSATSLALRAIADLDEYDKQAIDEFLRGLDGIVGTSDDNYFASEDDVTAVLVDIPDGAPLGNQISVLTVKVTVSEAGYSFTLWGTMSTTSEAPAMEQSGSNLRYPFDFLELREQPGFDNARPL
ncbi:general secretion pathway protein GspK [Pelagicoccus albus]|uniref:General secretion pathway protein GspK n=1 Tax=Pelagicoccus albus TaxID=415222 RepID=A0A7X1B2U5_9BACT|nr:type II secretion system protein GspK [Pelagicoccus albus]MBC2604472.1 general secretion pathway protein GspK [Pelagicoccus albus]